MKVFNKWLVIATVNNHNRVAAHFAKKQEAEQALTSLFAKISDNEWQDDLGQRFHIEKNVKEYHA